MPRQESDYPGALDIFDNQTTDFNPGDAVPSTDFERLIDAVKTIQTKLGITGGTALLDSAVTINNSEADKDFRVAATGATNAFFVQGSDGKIGIGTAVIPHGGIGVAMLALERANASVDGPHVQFTTTTDDYPLLAILPWEHDNIALCFDAYESTGSKSADAGSNFQIIKRSDLLKIRYDSGIAQGAAITWNDGIILSTSGTVTIPNLLSVTGGQIEFPASQSVSGDANTLDDYQEGTWTPAFISTDNTFTYGTQQGSYVKIGRTVFCNFWISSDTATINTGGNSVQISGLPFTVVNTTLARGGGTIGRAETFAGDVPCGVYLIDNQSKIFLNYRTTANGVSINLTGADMKLTAGNTIYGSFFYRAE